ncbi:MAG: response regulator [Lachnospiraceae bacterium]|nr:response regulator [Lachnospiraceae bacterium]
MERDELRLTDLINVDTLQNIQDSFCGMCNLAIGIADADGVMVTKDTLGADFCCEYVKKTAIGKARCEACDKKGGELAYQEGKAVIFNCHTGLVDFAAPIIANGVRVGSINGGQVRTEDIPEEKLRQYADEIGVDADGFVAAYQKIRLIDKEELERSTDFIYRMSKIISDMAYDRYSLMNANEEIERAAQMKTDFLANMSHEIRTPMNAVIGMAEMALREELPSEARGYVGQIITSGKALLTIINDILDFSKIEAGKMTIEEDEYEPMSMINDITNIINTRIGEKDVELILDISPEIPCKLLGDVNRLKQVIINLANNAVKFTNEGQVVLSMHSERKANGDVELSVCVKDTGIGIKQEDLLRLFEAFQQVNSKRNRNIEGTGLGLAISERIVKLMGGRIWAESEYGKGSSFYFCVPQKVLDNRASISVKKREEIRAAGLVANGYLREHLIKDMQYLGVAYESLEGPEELSRLTEKNISYLFVGQGIYSAEIEEFVKEHPEIKVILMTNFRDSFKFSYKNFLVVKKPVYVLTLAAVFNGEDLNMGYTGHADDFEFIAPEAEILIVDDNAINLTVAEGLLKPLKMKIDTAISGQKAIEMITAKHYDLIFMDHMMPEIDGVETTHIIRRFYKEYEDVPIIALTANAVGGTKEMFLSEGMNDFVAKPIEMRVILSKLRTWLPKEKIVKNVKVEEDTQEVLSENVIQIEGLDTQYALKLLGNKELFMAVLKDYYKAIDKKCEAIKKFEMQEDWHAYTIEVHALKSSSKQIGALELSKFAMQMEKAGNEKDGEQIHRCTDDLLKQYRRYKKILEPLFEMSKEKEDYKAVASKEEILELLLQIRSAAEELDMDSVTDILAAFGAYELSERSAEIFAALENAVQDYDVETCEALVDEWEELIKM